MPITSPAQLESFLEKQGYAPHVAGESVFVPIGGSAAPYTAAFTFLRNGQLQITCQLALLRDIPEDKLGHFAVAALDANTQICPYAFAVIGAGEGDADVGKAPLVLMDSMPTEDLNEPEISYALDRLLEALTYSREILKLGLTGAAA